MHHTSPSFNTLLLPISFFSELFFTGHQSLNASRNYDNSHNNAETFVNVTVVNPTTLAECEAALRDVETSLRNCRAAHGMFDVSCVFCCV